MSELGSPDSFVGDFGMESEGENSYSGYGDEYSTLAHMDLGSPASSMDTDGQGAKKSSTKSRYKHVPHSEKPPQIVEKRNARERKRVQTVNSAFIKLRKYIPYENRHKRLSKVKTLRNAIEYIQHLQQLIEDYDEELSGPAAQQGLTSVSMAPSQLSMATSDMSEAGMIGLCRDVLQTSSSFGMLLSSGSALVSMDQSFLPPIQTSSLSYSKPPHATLPQGVSADYHHIMCSYTGPANVTKPLPTGDVTCVSSTPGFDPSLLPDTTTTANYLPPLIHTMPAPS